MAPTRMAAGIVASLLAIALLLVAGQSLIQDNLRTQAADSHTINLAGRQRMLSQRLAKSALAIRFATDRGTRGIRVAELRTVADLWEKSQRGLQVGDPSLGLPGHNPPEIAAMFVQLEPIHQGMLSNARSLLDAVAKQDKGELADPGWSPYVQGILNQDIAYVTGMDAIVTAYDHAAAGRVQRLRGTERLLLGMELSVIAFLGAFVLAPLVGQVRRAFEQQAAAQARIAEQNEELARRNDELEAHRREIGTQRVQLSTLESMLSEAQALLER